MPGHDEHPFRDFGRACLEAFWYRRAIFDNPPWPGWPDHLKPWRKWGK